MRPHPTDQREGSPVTHELTIPDTVGASLLADVQRERAELQLEPESSVVRSARLDELLGRVELHLASAGDTSPRGSAAVPYLAEVAQALAADRPIEQTLQAVVELAVDSVPGCDYAGVSLLRPGKSIESPAVTDNLVAQCDAVQYELNEGPCLDAIWDDATRLINDTATDEQWPNFARRAAALGIGGLLAAQLDTGRGSIGALNLYARAPHSYDDESRSIALAFAAHAAIALANAQREQHLRTAVDSRQSIGQAVGILMERHGLGAGAAFDLLVRTSQRSSMKLRDIAAKVVEGGSS
jgi:GAF domain-containing protein